MPRPDRERLSTQLERILRRGPHSVSQLVELTGRHKETLRASLHEMRDRGLVRSESTPALTTKGRSAVWVLNDA